MDCPRCQGLVVEDFVVDVEKMVKVFIGRCLNCGWVSNEPTLDAKQEAHSKVAEHERELALALAYRSRERESTGRITRTPWRKGLPTSCWEAML